MTNFIRGMRSKTVGGAPIQYLALAKFLNDYTKVSKLTETELVNVINEQMIPEVEQPIVGENPQYSFDTQEFIDFFKVVKLKNHYKRFTSRQFKEVYQALQKKFQLSVLA